MCNLNNLGLQIPTDNTAKIDKEFSRNLSFSMGDLLRLPNIANYKYYYNLNDKLEKEVGDFLAQKTNNPKQYSNAIRHQYVSALYARNFEQEAAKSLGNLYEKATLGAGLSGRYDTQLDKINNEIGIIYANKYPNISRQELLQKLLDNYYKNHEYVKSRMRNY